MEAHRWQRFNLLQDFGFVAAQGFMCLHRRSIQEGLERCQVVQQPAICHDTQEQPPSAVSFPLKKKGLVTRDMSACMLSHLSLLRPHGPQSYITCGHKGPHDIPNNDMLRGPKDRGRARVPRAPDTCVHFPVVKVTRRCCGHMWSSVAWRDKRSLPMRFFPQYLKLNFYLL